MNACPPEFRVRSIAPMLALALGLSGCAAQETVTHYKPFFSGLEGAEFAGQRPVVSGRSAEALAGVSTGQAISDESTASGIIERPDGSREFVTTSVSHLTRHIEFLLDENSDQADRELLEQLIDERTKDHYQSQGKPPEEYVRWLHKNRRDIARMLARMPMAERTPTVIVRQPGDNTWIIELTGQAARDVKFTQLWVRQYLGRWRLVHFK